MTPRIHTVDAEYGISVCLRFSLFFNNRYLAGKLSIIYGKIFMD
jgi:hypothetical protein